MISIIVLLVLENLINACTESAETWRLKLGLQTSKRVPAWYLDNTLTANDLDVLDATFSNNNTYHDHDLVENRILSANINGVCIPLIVLLFVISI